MTGTVFHIQRFSTGDGPGIRSTVFLKGCPLACKWCHNPESQSAGLQLAYYRQKCLRCGACAAVCPQSAIAPGEGGNTIDFSSCTHCGRCVSACPGDALEIFGRQMSADEVVRIASRDRSFYGAHGGVTLSGGEPCVQSAFALELLQQLRARGIHTALDTCGACAWAQMQPLMPYTDLVLFDLKHMDSAQHRRMTGLGNERILENFRNIQALGVRTRVRIPVIPGYNDSRENWDAIVAFLKPYPQVAVELLPYHKLGSGKYEAIGMRWEMPACEPPTDAAMQAHRAYLARGGVRCVRGSDREQDAERVTND